MKTTTNILKIAGEDIIRAQRAYVEGGAAYDGERQGRALQSYKDICETLAGLGISIDAALAAAR